MTDVLTLDQRQERAERRVNRFVGRFEASYYELVCHAALPLVLTPELVSYLRNEFLRELPWIAEVDLLLSELCSPVGYELYVMDADVRAYVLAKRSETFNADRMREVANLLISYVRYLADHSSQLSDQELETQQWAALLYLGASERQQVVTEIVERFQSSGVRGTQVGGDLFNRAEMARLAQITQTLKTQLTDYPGLIEYASLVSDVQMRNVAIEQARVEKSYAVAPGQFLRLPSVMQTELRAKNRIEVRPGQTVPVREPSVTQDAADAAPTQSLADVGSDDRFAGLNLELFEFNDAQLVDEPGDPEPRFPPPLQTEDITIITFDPPQQGEQSQQTVITDPIEPPLEVPEGLERFEFKIAKIARDGTRWVVRQRRGAAYRYVETLPTSFLARITRRIGFGNTVDLEMVSIPGGKFLMGSPENEPERNADRESPQHEVTVPPFLMGRYPVTQAQWRIVANTLPPVNRELKSDPSRNKGENHPVERVTWYDAVEFCDRLSNYTGRQYRLPSEAEWEYACRAGTIPPFHFGDTISTEVANYHGSSYADGPQGERRGETTPVDHFGIANAFGLSDMHGNVDEWCQDDWHENYEGAPNDGSARLSSGESNFRVRRGGSWNDYPMFCRSACRNWLDPGFGYSDLGFRVVCSSPRALQ